MKCIIFAVNLNFTDMKSVFLVIVTRISLETNEILDFEVFGVYSSLRDACRWRKVLLSDTLPLYKTVVKIERQYLG